MGQEQYCTFQKHTNIRMIVVINSYYFTMTNGESPQNFEIQRPKRMPNGHDVNYETYTRGGFQFFAFD